jgi:hypothetical protein
MSNKKTRHPRAGRKEPADESRQGRRSKVNYRTIPEICA